MRRSIALLILLSPFLCAHAKSKPNPADYAITVHVTGSHLIDRGGYTCESIDTIVDGQRYLMRNINCQQTYVFQLGDYPARIVKEDKIHTYELMRIYEFLLPDGQTRQFQISGIPDSTTPSGTR